MLIFQESIPASVGPVRSARYYYIAWAAEWRRRVRPRRRLAAGPPDAARPRATASSSTTPTSSAGATSFHRVDGPLRAAQPVHDRQEPARDRASASGRRTSPIKPAWTFAPDAPLAQRPQRRPDPGRVPVQHDHATTTTARRTRTCARSPARSKQIDAADRQAGRAEERRRHAHDVRAAQRRHPTSTASRPTSSAAGTAWIATNGTTIKGTWKKASLTKPTRFFDAGGKPVTLTVGQTFVQVMHDGHEGHDHGTARPAPPPRRPGLERRGSAPSRASSPLRHGASARGDLGVDRAGLARRRRPRSGSRLGALAGGGGEPAVDPVVGPGRRERRRRGGPGRAARRGCPAGPTISGSAPTADATTGVPQAIASMAGSPAASETTGRTTARAPRTSAASRSSGEARRVGERVADALAGGRAGERRAVVRRRADEQDPRRPRHRRRRAPTGPAGRGERRERPRAASPRSWRAS